MWEKIKAWFRHFATIVWARLVSFGGLVIAALGTVADLFELLGIKDSIQTLLDSRHAPYYIVAFALMTELTRRRTLNKDAD